MVAFILSLLSAVALALVTEVATGAISAWFRKLRSRLGDSRAGMFDPRPDGLYCVGLWSPVRTLRPEFLTTEMVPAADRPQQPYIDHALLAETVETRSKTSSGDTMYLIGFRIDHRESEDTQYCRIRQASSVYPEVLAIEDLRIHNPTALAKCDDALAHDVGKYLTHAVPSSLAINLVVVSTDNELLCVERSAAVDSAVGWWTVGVFETMKQPDANRPGAPEHLFGLAARGLDEELGLGPNDHGPIQITWLGIFQAILRGHVVAVVKLKISKDELIERVNAAHSRYEHATIAWIPLRRGLVTTFLKATPMRTIGKVGFTLNIDGRPFIDQSRLAVVEAWRFRHALDD